MCYEYSDTYEKWWKFNNNIDKINSENIKFKYDYIKSVEI